MMIVKIREPFWSAGKDKFYGWDKDYNNNSAGLGIDLFILKGEGKLGVMVGDKPTIYTIDKVKARELIDKYGSKKMANKDSVVELGVIPWAAFVSEEE